MDTEWTDIPVCPWCGDKVHDWYEYRDLEFDGDEVKIECGACLKPYRIVMDISTSFTTTKVESDGV